MNVYPWARLRRSCYLTLVSNVFKEVLISLFWPPTDSRNYQKCILNFPSTWFANRHWLKIILTGQSWHILKSWYTGRDPEHGCWCCFADGPTVSKSLVPSVAQATHALVCFNLLISSKGLPAFRHDLTDQIPLAIILKLKNCTHVVVLFKVKVNMYMPVNFAG